MDIKYTPPSSGVKINLLYFASLFCALALMHLSSLLWIEGEPSSLRWIFLLSTTMQCLSEVSLFALIGGLLYKYSKSWIFYFFIFLSFWLCIAQMVDFFLLRFMGTTVWHSLEFLKAENLGNLVEALRASNVSFKVWILGGLLILLLPGVGFLFFYLTQLWKQSVQYVSLNKLLASVIIPLVCLMGTDLLFTQKESFYFYEKCRQTLPFKTTFLMPSSASFALNAPPSKGKNEQDLKALLTTLPVTPSKKPPIFIVIIESLREDQITQEIAPHIFKFKQDNISFDLATSGGNSTPLSWFTIFHSSFPFTWSQPRFAKNTLGSPALNLFKEMGYKIHVYSTPSLAFYRMGESIFGEKHHLADSVTTFSEIHPTGWESDKAAMEAMTADAARYNDADGHLFITFLDATHFGYSFPPTHHKFTPFLGTIDYLSACWSQKDVAQIKNRYKNSIHFVDSLFGNFLSKLPRSDSVIFVTGDHGEEFYEHGQLFHASHLSLEQTQVPLYYKFGENTEALRTFTTKMSSHIDVFPTLIDYIDPSLPVHQFLEGESIFKANRWPFTVSARFNAGQHPYEFFIHNGKEKLLLWFHNTTSIFESNKLRILSLKNRNDEVIAFDKDDLLERFGPAIERLSK